MAINDNIQVAVSRWAERGRVPTEIFMSKLTQHHLAGELYKRIEANYSNPKHITMRGKAKAVSPSEMAERLPTELTFGAIRLKVRIKEGVPTDSFILDSKELVRVIDYKTGKEEWVARSG
jgi:hypothetical protein